MQVLSKDNLIKVWSKVKSYVENKTNELKYESNLKFGGKSLVDSYSPVDAAMAGSLGANRFAGLTGKNVTTEISYDNGDSWEVIDFGNAIISSIFADGIRAGYSLRSTRTVSEITQKSNRLRVTIGSGVYTELNKFILYTSTNGSGVFSVDIEAAKYQASEYELLHTARLSGWSGYNVVNLTKSIIFGNSKTKPSYYERLRFTFYIPSTNNINTDYTGFRIQNIYAYGGMGWSTPTSLASSGHLYEIKTTDEGKLDAEFPNVVKAVSFKGNIEGKATSASALSPESGTTLLKSNRILTESYEEVNGGTPTFTGTYPTGTYNLNSSSLYTSIENVKNKGFRPLLKVILNTHTCSASIPLTRKADGTYTGIIKGTNGNYFVEASISSSSQTISTQGFGTYTKPSAGIPKSDLSPELVNILDRVEPASVTAVKESSTANFKIASISDNIDFENPLLIDLILFEGTRDSSTIVTHIPASLSVIVKADGRYDVTLSGSYVPNNTTYLSFVRATAYNISDQSAIIGKEILITPITGANPYARIGSFE